MLGQGASGSPVLPGPGSRWGDGGTRSTPLRSPRFVLSCCKAPPFPTPFKQAPCKHLLVITLRLESGLG